MNAPTCQHVQDDIELFAAGECDPATRAAIERHLEDCPSCSAALADAQQMLGLLTLRLREPAALARLQQRLRADAKKQHRVVPLVFLGRVAALAALLLLTVGIYFWVAPEPGKHTGEAVAMIQRVSADAVYEVGGTHEMTLQRGEVFVALPAQEAGKSFTVHTPAGDASTQGAECYIKVAPGAPAVSVSVARGKVELSNAQGTATVRSGETASARRGAAPMRAIENLALRFGRVYQPVPVKAGKRPRPALPVDLARVLYYPEMAKQLPIGGAEVFLKQQGFAVLSAEFGDLVSPYEDLRARGLPTLITVDTLLHLYRLQLTATLRDIEEHTLAEDLAQLTQTLLLAVQGEDATARIYLAVGLRLQRPDAALPAGVDGASVASIVETIESGGRMAAVPGLGYAADFADFQPVGHYAHSKKLQGYYRAMQWFGRMPLLLRGGAGWRVPESAARQQTLAARQIATALFESRLPDGRSAHAVWQRIETVTAFYVGLSLDPGPEQYRAAGTNQDNLDDFRDQLAKYLALPPFAAVTRSSGNEVPTLEAGAGFHLFGQRFAPDVYALDKLVYPNVGPAKRTGQFTAEVLPSGKVVRGLPRGLDLAALLGSPLARELLHESGDDAYAGNLAALSYDQALEKLQRDFARFDAVDWNSNLYWSWLYTLEPLLREPGSLVYRTRLLSTGLASWTQLRRDTVLYTKKRQVLAEPMPAKTLESVLPGWQPAPPVVLEALPEVYGRLLALTRMSRKQLTALAVLDARGHENLQMLETLLERVLRLAENEGAGMAQSKDDEEFLRGLAVALDAKRTDGPIHTAMVATVAADFTGQMVLQEAIGKVDLAIAIVSRPDGTLLAVVGPVLSYYEMKRPRGEAWTAETWLPQTAPPRPFLPQIYADKRR